MKAPHAFVLAVLLSPFALLFGPLASGVSAEQLTVELDANESTVSFTLGATLHAVEGTVAVEDGTLEIDTESGAVSGRIVVSATSADTGHERRDRDMHAKVLESESYPEFVFEATRLEGTLATSGASEVTLHGELAIHGGSHPISLPTTVTIDGDRFEASALLTVPYVEWGMKNPSKAVLRVKKFVEVEIDAVGTITRAEAPTE